MQASLPPYAHPRHCFLTMMRKEAPSISPLHDRDDVAERLVLAENEGEASCC
jgi:hypothetical protein